MSYIIKENFDDNCPGLNTLIGKMCPGPYKTHDDFQPCCVASCNAFNDKYNYPKCKTEECEDNCEDMRYKQDNSGGTNMSSAEYCACRKNVCDGDDCVSKIHPGDAAWNQIHNCCMKNGNMDDSCYSFVENDLMGRGPCNGDSGGGGNGGGLGGGGNGGGGNGGGGNGGGGNGGGGNGGGGNGGGGNGGGGNGGGGNGGGSNGSDSGNGGDSNSGNGNHKLSTTEIIGISVGVIVLLILIMYMLYRFKK